MCAPILQRFIERDVMLLSYGAVVPLDERNVKQWR
jgi:hypothetical protein